MRLRDHRGCSSALGDLGGRVYLSLDPEVRMVGFLVLLPESARLPDHRVGLLEEDSLVPFDLGALRRRLI